MISGDSGTVIGRATRWRGDLECAENLQIDGIFEGTIRHRDGQLTIGSEANVHAFVVADNVRVSGHMEGDIHASGKVELRANAVVIGDIYSARFSMEESTTLHGRVGQPIDAATPDMAIPPAAPTLTERAKETASAAVVMPSASVDAAEGRYRPVSVADPGHEPPQHQTAALPAPVSVTQSGRQLPSALAAFAAGGRQKIGGTERKDTHASEDVRWLGRDHEE